SYLVVPPLLLILFFPILKDHAHLIRNLYDTTRVTKRLVVIAIVLGVALFGISVASNVAMSAYEISIRDNSPLGIGLASSWSCTNVWYLILGIAISALLIPVIEEVINRGFLLNYFMPRGKWLAILLSSLLFALFHKPQTIVLAFLFGIFLAHLTLNSGSLLPATIAHSIHNLLVQFDSGCLTLTWLSSNTLPDVVRHGRLAALSCFLLFCLATILVSRKVTGTRTVPL
ncbi:MAG: CPBP family intramembrane glutamic endopeptidase, partial [Pseudomonadales bacterium]